MSWTHRTPIFFLPCIVFWCLMVLANASADIAQIDRLRYSSQSDYTRIVLDLSAGIATYEVISGSGKQLTLRFQPCRSNPAIPATHTNLNSELMKQIEFETSDGDVLLMHIQLKVAVNARVFTMESPDRIVMDLRPVIPIESPSITPDPAQAVPLKVNPDPLDQIIQTAATQREETERQETGTDIQPTAQSQTREPEPATEQAQAAASLPERAASAPPAEVPRIEGPETPNRNGTQTSGETAEQEASTKEPEPPILPLRATPTVDNRWTFSNPWLIGQLMLNLFLIAMILLLFRHAQKLNSSLRLMRVKLNGLEQSRVQSMSSEQKRVLPACKDTAALAARHERLPQSQTRPEQPQNSAVDFDQLLQNPGPEESDIRTATAHGRARQRSQQKKRNRLDSTPRQTTETAETDRASRQAARQTPAPLEPRPDRSPARRVPAKKDETATEDLSFDELRNALSKISMELDRLIDADDVPEASTRQTNRRAEESQSGSPAMPARSVQERVIDLAQQGHEPIEISRSLEMPRGEVELILSLHNDA